MENNNMATRMAGNICITSTFDRNYMASGKTLFKSIRHHTDCTGIDFKVITADPEVIKEFGAENCHIVTDEIKKGYANVKYCKELPQERYCHSWYRYEIFNMTEYDRVMCIDSDCLCPRDISHLFSEELNDYDLISVEDHVVSKGFTKCMPHLEKQGLNFSGLRRRLAAGQIDVQPALLVANKSIVNKAWYHRLLHYANTSGFTYSIDEGILNDFIYLDNLNIKLLPLEWDYQDLYEIHYPILPVPSHPFIVHCEVSKPFKKTKSQIDKRLHKWHDKWWRESRSTGYQKSMPHESRGVLDDLAIKHKADKSSLYHNFAVKYDSILSPFQKSFTNVLEIGVDRGQSIKMWADYFPNATIHGVDINGIGKECAVYSPQIQIHMIDQGESSQLKRLNEFGPFDIIIDDGNHFWKEQVISFQTLFSYVKPGGFYIIEDTCTSYWNEYKNAAVSCVEYFKKLVDEVNLRGARGRPLADMPDELLDVPFNWDQGWQRREDCHANVPEFESIQFMNAIIVIRKRK
jgi:lipopolysaccharide biosynthesis glycosyltransferase